MKAQRPKYGDQTMRRSYALAAAFAASLILAAPALAGNSSAAEQVAAGRAFVLKVCWPCHIVAKGQTHKPLLSHPAPSFLAIAQQPDVTAASLRHFLASHGETMGKNGAMPNPRLVGYQIEEVTAYIMSLKK